MPLYVKKQKINLTIISFDFCLVNEDFIEMRDTLTFSFIGYEELSISIKQIIASKKETFPVIYQNGRRH